MKCLITPSIINSVVNKPGIDAYPCFKMNQNNDFEVPLFQEKIDIVEETWVKIYTKNR